MADDMLAQPGSGVVLVGGWQLPEVRALAHRINAKLHAPGDYLLPPDDDETSGAIADLADQLHRGDATGVLCVLFVQV